MLNTKSSGTNQCAVFKIDLSVDNGKLRCQFILFFFFAITPPHGSQCPKKPSRSPSDGDLVRMRTTPSLAARVGLKWLLEALLTPLSDDDLSYGKGVVKEDGATAVMVLFLFGLTSQGIVKVGHYLV